MGYTTEFEGQVKVVPPLNSAEVAFLTKFSETRRMRRERGPYYVDSDGFRGQSRDADVLDYNAPPDGQPGLWCQWIPTADGSAIEWDGGEKFYDSEEWMAYLINHFLRPGAVAASTGDPQFAEFTFDHVLNGHIDAQGQEMSDRWRLRVNHNEVSTARRLPPVCMIPDCGCIGEAHP